MCTQNPCGQWQPSRANSCLLMRETKKKRKKKERHKEITAGLLSGPWSQGTPAVKTSNHMRKSKRFLRVPLLDLLNFYNLVGCQAVGSIDTFHAMPLLSPEKQKRERESKQDCWLNHPSHSQHSCFYDLCLLSERMMASMCGSVIIQPHTEPTHSVPFISPVSMPVALRLCFEVERGWVNRAHTLTQNKGVSDHLCKVMRCLWWHSCYQQWAPVKRLTQTAESLLKKTDPEPDL